MSKPTKKEQKIKYKKAPGAPRRFKSAYMFFSEYQHKEIRQQSQDKKMRAADVAKLVSRAWKDMSDEDREVWVNKGKVDRQRFEREKAVYRGPWKIPIIANHPDAPKKPMSAFLAFGNERRAIIAEANPTLTGTEISTLLSKLWKQCPDALKKVYRDREAQDRAVFKQRLTEWERQKDQELVMEYHCSSSNVTETGGESTTVGDEDWSSLRGSHEAVLRRSPASRSTPQPQTEKIGRTPRESGTDIRHIPTEISMPNMLRSMAHDETLEPELDYLANAIWPVDALVSDDPCPTTVATDGGAGAGAGAPSVGSSLSAGRLEASLDELLQNEALFFEDFAPTQVISPRTSN